MKSLENVSWKYLYKQLFLDSSIFYWLFLTDPIVVREGEVASEISSTDAPSSSSVISVDESDAAEDQGDYQQVSWKNETHKF